ncbi:AsmA-like C-terminal domain-containing protein, partial [Rhizobium ruizarguesonis]
GGVINITSGDAGAVSRFADLYQHMQGGLLNLAIRLGAEGGWDGSLDVRRFAIVNEQRLRSIVSTPVGSEQRSLNEAVKRDIDTSSQRFQRGFARVVSRNGMVGIENGVLRGDQIGATFQGTVRDRKGNMDMTGTFMPAYGLNRLFAELPLIGVILGNGSDRGLIGITFKLTGKFDQPNLQINTLSNIATGVFRQIFEFQ